MRPISLTALRSNLFKIVDQVIETGNPVELERNGHRLKIVLEAKKSKLENLKPHVVVWLYAGLSGSRELRAMS